MDDSGDAVLGLIDRGRLSTALTAIHRGGQGHHARVLDAARGDLSGQIQRAGVTTPVDLSAAGPESVVILIHSPGRIAKTRELLQQTGATWIQVVNRIGAESPRPFNAVPLPSRPSRSRSRRTVPPAPTMPALPTIPANSSASLDD